MDYVMEQIKAVLGLIENQDLTPEEQLRQIREIISTEMEQQKDHSYKMGLKKGRELITDFIEEKFGQL